MVTQSKPLMEEAEFRKLVQRALDRVEAAFEDVDPDLAECEQAFGALTITFADRSRCIISTQPSVRQVWLALASRGTAYHFDYESGTGQWRDDKGQGIELLSFLEKFLGEMTKLEVKI